MTLFLNSKQLYAHKHTEIKNSPLFVFILSTRKRLFFIVYSLPMRERIILDYIMPLKMGSVCRNAATTNAANAA